jgi:GT2 family glycosyltransferase
MRAGFLMLSADEGHLLVHSLAAAVAEPFDGGLVIDNASSDDTATIAATHGVPVLTLPNRVPYTEAMNAGIAELGSEFDAVALLTGDTFVTPGYLEACLRALSDERNLGSVAPRLIRTAGPLPEQRIDQLDAIGMTIDRRRKNRLIGHGDSLDCYRQRAPVFGADGAAAFWRVAALWDCTVDDEVFDTSFASAEGAVWACDADLAWRAQLFGWRALYEPQAVVHHIRTYSPTTRANTRPADRRTQFRNRLLMIVKNDTPRDLSRDILPLIAYELAAFAYALVVERELLAGYREAFARLRSARRWHRSIRAKRVIRRAPFGLLPPS